MTETIPTEPGWYFARHTDCRYPWVRFEPVQVIAVSFTDDFRVRVIGLATLLPPDAFTWGPRITMPEGLGEGE